MNETECECDLVKIILDNISDDYCQYLQGDENNDTYTLIEKNDEVDYKFNLILDRNKKYLILKNLDKLKEKLSFEGVSLSKSKKDFCVKDCDYIIIVPSDREIYFIELKQTRNSQQNKESILQLKGGVFWLHLIYNSLLLIKDGVLNFESLEDINKWTFMGLVLQGQKGRNNKELINRSVNNVSVRSIGKNDLSFTTYAATMSIGKYFTLKSIVKKGYYNKHNKCF